MLAQNTDNVTEVMRDRDETSFQSSIASGQYLLTVNWVKPKNQPGPVGHVNFV